MASGSIWYGGIQVVLGLIVVIPAITTDAPVVVSASCVALLLTGLYAMLGFWYLRILRNSVSSEPSSPSHPHLISAEHYLKLNCYFLKAYASCSIVIVLLGLASFIQGTLLYFEDDNTSEGAAPAISGVASVLINIFISGYCVADYKRLKLGGTDEILRESRPRSPTPNAYRNGEIDVIHAMEISSIPLPAVAFPPAYSQIYLDPKDDDLPPSYLDSLATSSEDVSLYTVAQLPPFAVSIPIGTPMVSAVENGQHRDVTFEGITQNHADNVSENPHSLSQRSDISDASQWTVIDLSETTH